ncbi:MAG: YdcF family protein [Pacificimonas sp.]
MNYFLWGMFGPVSWPVWLAIIGVLALFLKRRRLANMALGTAAITGIAFAFLPLGPALMGMLERQYPPVSTPGVADHILVLAGGEDLQAGLWSGRMELKIAGDRPVQAALLARRMPSAQLWIAGYGDGNANRASDTGAVAAYWRKSGIAAKRIHELKNTADTCANLAAFEASGRVLLVTSAFHMPRAMACARKTGLDLQPHPVDYNSRPDFGGGPSPVRNYTLLDLAAHEYVGLLWYRLTGRID